MTAGQRASQWTRVLAIAALLGAVPATAAAADTKTVTLEGAAFKPREVRIEPGDTVRWEYVNGGNHTVTFDDKSFDSHPNCRNLGILEDCFQDGDAPIRRTFETPGKFPYYCRVHGAANGQGMAGVVEVASDDSSATSGPTTSATSQVAPASTATTATTAPPTTSTTRPLSTSSTVIRSTTTTVPAETTTTFAPAEAPSFDPEAAAGEADVETEAASDTGDSGTAVPAIVALLLGVAGAGGALLWRLRPGRGAPKSKP